MKKTKAATPAGNPRSMQTVEREAVAGGTYSFLALRLDKLADSLGIDVAHLAQFPAELDRLGMEADDLTPDLIHEARRLHRHIMRGWCDRNGFALN